MTGKAHLPCRPGGRGGCRDCILQIIITVACMQGPPAMRVPMHVGSPHPVLQLVQQQHPQEARHQDCPDCPIRQRLICMQVALRQWMSRRWPMLLEKTRA